jgi:hypothetical protein
MNRRVVRVGGSALIALVLVSDVAAAQDAPPALAIGAHAIGLFTQATHTPEGRTLTEAYLTQPIVSADARAGWLQAVGMLNFEGLTLRRGELDLGEWGEGYVDRRHPHAYLHELMVGAAISSAPVVASLYAGRGFVPFGSDDPMSRPFVSYPVDHHLAQLLERLVVVGAVRARALLLEAAAFDGDEPLDPSTPQLARRFADSWSMRGTLSQALPALGDAELAASYANVKSPEYREGRGMDQRKAHASLRVDGGGRFAHYVLAELARTTDVDRGRDLYTFDAALAEGAVCRDDAGLALRWERADRPEEERLVDLFRAPRPATDLSILGITQWTTLTVAAALPALRLFGAHAAPFLEAARIRVDRTTAALFDPVRFYGSNLMWRTSVGLRLGVGHDHRREGRYGAAVPTASTSLHAHDESSPAHCFR